MAGVARRGGALLDALAAAEKAAADAAAEEGAAAPPPAAAAVPRLSAAEGSELRALLRALAKVGAAGRALDFCGTRFVLRVLVAQLQKGERRGRRRGSRPCRRRTWRGRHRPTATVPCSSCASRWREGAPTGRRCARSASASWLGAGDPLRGAIEAAAKASFQRNRDPHEAALYYLALGKKSALQALCKAVRNEKLHGFLSNDFSTERWRSAAMKNGFSLMSKQQYEMAAGFFLLGGDVEAAVKLCARQLGDLQLALVLARLHSADLESSLVEDEVLTYADERSDAWLRAVALLMLRRPSEAVDAFAAPRMPRVAAGGLATCGLQPIAQFEPSCAPFCRRLLANPRWRLPRARSRAPSSLGCAYAYGRRGAPLHGMLALRHLADDADADADADAPGRGERSGGRSAPRPCARRRRCCPSLAARHVLDYALLLAPPPPPPQPPPSLSSLPPSVLARRAAAEAAAAGAALPSVREAVAAARPHLRAEVAAVLGRFGVTAAELCAEVRAAAAADGDAETLVAAALAVSLPPPTPTAATTAARRRSCSLRLTRCFIPTSGTRCPRS